MEKVIFVMQGGEIIKKTKYVAQKSVAKSNGLKLSKLNGSCLPSGLLVPPPGGYVKSWFGAGMLQYRPILELIHSIIVASLVTIVTILEDVLERLRQAVPKVPIFPHKDHPQVMLAVVQQVVIKYQVIDPTDAQQILAALHQESQKYLAQHESDVSPADYEVVWPDIEVILSQATKRRGG